MAATPSAPAGSRMLRVSWNTSLMAAQTASVSTTTKSSTSARAMRKVSSPTSLTAVPSENSPTSASCTRRPWRTDCSHGVGVDRLHADDADLGPHRLDVGGHAGDQPAAADGDEDGVDRPLVLAQDLHRHRALAGDHVGVVEGVHEGQALRLLQFQRVRVGVGVAVAVQHDLAAQRMHGVDLQLAASSPASRSRRGSRACAPTAPRPARGCRPRRRSRRAPAPRRPGAPSCCRRRAA